MARLPRLPAGWEHPALHYRRSLASRVTLLATIAVGLSVAVVAAAAFCTVKHQLMETLD